MSTTTTEVGSTADAGLPLRVLVLGPSENGGSAMCQILSSAGLESSECSDVADLCRSMEHGGGAAVVTEEALTDEARARIGRLLASQPAWSDFPVLVLRAKGTEQEHDDEDSFLHGLEETGYLAVLDRPLRRTTFVSAVRSAIRARRRQYQARDELLARTRFEAALREREWRIRRLVDGNIIGVLSADVDRIFEANEAFLAIIDATPADLTAGRIDWRALTPPEHVPKDEIALDQLRKRGKCQPYEKELFRMDGSRVPILIGASVLTREPLTWTCFVLDQTLAKRHERALQELNETLEQKVAERTAMAERRARDLRRLAAELSEAEHRERTRLARLLHDDLQQSIMAARLRLPALRSGDPQRIPAIVDKLEAALDECVRTTKTLSHELSPPILKSGTLLEVVQWLGEWFRNRFDLAVEIEAPPDLPGVADPLRLLLFQAVRELLFNVVKHASKKEARIVIDVDRADVGVEVRDGGSGFDPVVVERGLLNPKGFGLFHIRERVEALGGHLEILSTPGGGGRFRIVVPLERRETTPTTAPADETSVRKSGD
jgi:signal transduction histidine kinase